MLVQCGSWRLHNAPERSLVAGHPGLECAWYNSLFVILTRRMNHNAWSYAEKSVVLSSYDLKSAG